MSDVTPDGRLYGDVNAWREQVLALLPRTWHLYPEGPLPDPGRASKALTQSVVMSSYHTERLPMGTLQWCEAAPEEPAFEAPPDHPDTARRIAAYFLFPRRPIRARARGGRRSLPPPHRPVRPVVALSTT